MLPQNAPRKAGEIDVDRVVALAKLEDCTTLGEAAAALTKRETMASLNDARALDRLSLLESAPSSIINLKPL
jgi:hypothetical protein